MKMSDLSKIILSNLAYNDSFSRRVAPFLQDSFFESHADKIVFKIIFDFIKQYNCNPTKDAILVCLDKKTDLNDELYKTLMVNHQVKLQMQYREFYLMLCLYHLMLILDMITQRIQMSGLNFIIEQKLKFHLIWTI